MTDTATTNSYKPIGKFQLVASVLWPSFFIAGVANSVFWIFVDPYDFGLITGFSDLSALGTYSLGFLAFWITLATSSFMTQFFSKPRRQVKK